MTAAANGPGDPHGVWLNAKKKVGVRIEDCEGRLCGRIVWLKRALDARGQPRRDEHNPDPALRNRALCGLTILDGFRHAGDDGWRDGRIYDPSDGRTYDATLALENDGTMNVRGYLGVSLLGRTVTWARAPQHIEHCAPKSKEFPR